MDNISDEFKKVKNPHDAGFKIAFKKRDVAKAFFRNYFPKEIVEITDFRYLKFENGSFVDEKLKDLHSDIVYRAKIRGKTAFFYILFEHQSKPDDRMVFRLLSYMVNFWREYIDQNPDTKTLPVILPAVLYHGKRLWNAPRSLLEIIENGEEFEKYIPDFSYDLYNLNDYEDERLLLGNAMALSVVLYLMKHIFDKDFNDRLVKTAEYLTRIRDEKTQLDFLKWMLGYSYHTRDDAREGVERAIEIVNIENARRVAMTYAEQLRQEGRREGRREGRQEGRQKGWQEGKRETLFEMLKFRFKSVSPVVEQKIFQSEMNLLDKFSASMFDFKTSKDAEIWWEKQENGGNA